MLTIYDLLAEAIENDLPKEFLLKFINHSKIVSTENAKKENEYIEIIKSNLRTSFKFASIKQTSTYRTNEIDEYETEENSQINVTVIADEAEYTLRELAETLQISYKTCAKRFKEMKVPRERREAKGSIYLGKTVKKCFQNQSN